MLGSGAIWLPEWDDYGGSADYYSDTYGDLCGDDYGDGYGEWGDYGAYGGGVVCGAVGLSEK